MKIKKKFGDKIYLEWIDAYTNDEWKSVEKAFEVDNECYCYTNAFYVGKKDGFLIVCHTKGKTVKNDIMGRLYIPEKWIRKVV